VTGAVAFAVFQRRTIPVAYKRGLRAAIAATKHGTKGQYVIIEIDEMKREM